ncbi:MAG: aspartyl protease family protein [Caulobacteraceae bacterium]|nr:aspartyl protease family protein [Caulobacter sp.]
MRPSVRPPRRAFLASLAAVVAAPARAQLRNFLDPRTGPIFDPGRDTTGPLALEPGVENAVFRGLLNGAPVRVLLDSGASLSIVDAGLARRLRLHGAEAQSVRDTAGLPTAGVQLSDVALRLPGLTFLQLATVALDLSPLAETGQEVPMILGAEAFGRLVVALDRARGTASFSTPAAANPPPDWATVALRADGARTRVLPLEAQGSHPIWAQFDLGSQSPLSASLAFAQAQGWLSGKRVSTWAAASVAGVTTERIATLEGVRLAGVALPPTPVELLERWDTPGAPLLAGYPLLSRFDLLADYPADRLSLKPGAGVGAAFRRDRSGLVLRPLASGGAEVIHVAAGSPAAQAGWRPGETVLAARDAQGRLLGEGWGFGPPGERVTLSTEGGGARSLTLADYF